MLSCETRDCRCPGTLRKAFGVSYGVKLLFTLGHVVATARAEGSEIPPESGRLPSWGSILPARISSGTRGYAHR